MSISSKVHDGAFDLVDEKNKATSASASGSEIVHDTYCDVNEKALLRKIDRKLLPAVTLLYLLSFLDRSNGGSLRLYTSLPAQDCSHRLSCQCACRRVGDRLAYQ